MILLHFVAARVIFAGTMLAELLIIPINSFHLLYYRYRIRIRIFVIDRDALFRETKRKDGLLYSQNSCEFLSRCIIFERSVRYKSEIE